MAEPRPRTRAATPRAPRRPAGSRPTRTPRARRRRGRPPSSAELAHEVRQAAVALLGRRAVVRRRAAIDGGDVGVRRARRPSSAATDVGCDAKPVRYSDANRKSPDRSPVKIRPVRLPPCAAGASPTTRTRAAGSPNPGSGRAQYRWPANRAGGSAAAASRHATSRGQTAGSADDLARRDRSAATCGASIGRRVRHFRSEAVDPARRRCAEPDAGP